MGAVDAISPTKNIQKTKACEYLKLYHESAVTEDAESTLA